MLSAFDLRPLELRKLIAVRRAGNVNHFETALGAMPGLVVLWVIIGAVLPFPPAQLLVGAALLVGPGLWLWVWTRGARGAGQASLQFLSLLLATLTAVAIPTGHHLLLRRR